jgi:hypothetical protein
MTSGMLTAPPEEPHISGLVDRRGEYRCSRTRPAVFPGGRHRVWFEPANAQLDDPVVNGTCQFQTRIAGLAPIVTLDRAEQTPVSPHGMDRR